VGHSDEENRLVSVTQGTHRTEYVYDGLGRRVRIIEKDPDATQTLQTTSDKKYLWVGPEIAEERSGTDGGTVIKRFFGQGFVDNDGAILFYTRDHLGSVRELVDMSQTVRARYDYDPYGIATKISGDRDSQLLYTGHYWHAQSGLYLTLFREYDPALGRWLSGDPSGIKWNSWLYLYCGNDPINNYDPDGQDGVYFWWSSGGKTVGHASVEIDGVYYSLWPTGVVQKGKVGMRPGKWQNYRQDVSEEGRPHDAYIPLDGPDLDPRKLPIPTEKAPIWGDKHGCADEVYDRVKKKYQKIWNKYPQTSPITFRSFDEWLAGSSVKPYLPRTLFEDIHRWQTYGY
jgi:RHS repeat-associated protein